MEPFEALQKVDCSLNISLRQRPRESGCRQDNARPALDIPLPLSCLIFFFPISHRSLTFVPAQKDFQMKNKRTKSGVGADEAAQCERARKEIKCPGIKIGFSIRIQSDFLLISHSPFVGCAVCDRRRRQRSCRRSVRWTYNMRVANIFSFG